MFLNQSNSWINKQLHYAINDSTIFNAVFTQINDKGALIVRCKKGEVHSSIYIFREDGKTDRLNIKDSDAFHSWNISTPLKNYLGPEDPRVFEWNGKLYLYYTMTNVRAQLPLRGIEYMPIDKKLTTRSRGIFLTPSISGSTSKAVEKNWVFFGNTTNTTETLLSLYSLRPFIIGEVVQDTLKSRIHREYDCLQRFDRIHLSSNALKVNDSGTVELMFLFNDKVCYRECKMPLFYSYIAFMDAESPFHLKRISKVPLRTKDENIKNFQYISSLTVAGKSALWANVDDTIVVSGGNDDSSVFLEPFKTSHILRLPTDSCSFKVNVELSLPILAVHTRLEEVNTFNAVAHTSVILATMSIVIFALVLLYFLRTRRNKNGLYEQVKDV